MTSEPPKILDTPVAILAGGKSSRFGADKALATLAGKALIRHVHDQIVSQTTGPVVINAGAPFQEMREVSVIADQHGPDVGPLAGIHTALTWARDQGYPCIATVSVDTPFLPGDLLTQFTTHGAPAYAESGGRKHPTIGLWRASDLALLDTALKDGVRAANAWIDLCSASPVAFTPDQGVDPFFNINTQDDLEIAEAFMHAS